MTKKRKSRRTVGMVIGSRTVCKSPEIMAAMRPVVVGPWNPINDNRGASKAMLNPWTQLETVMVIITTAIVHGAFENNDRRRTKTPVLRLNVNMGYLDP